MAMHLTNVSIAPFARIDSVLGDAFRLSGDGTHENDPATHLEVLVRLAGDEELAAGVDLEDAVELLLRDVLEVAEGDDTRVRDDDVELTEVRDRLVHQHDRVGDIGDVGLDGDGFARAVVHLAELLADDLGRLSAVGVVDDHLGAAAGELERGLAPDASPGAGHDSDFALQAVRWDALRGVAVHGGDHPGCCKGSVQFGKVGCFSRSARLARQGAFGRGIQGLRIRHKIMYEAGQPFTSAVATYFEILFSR